jgi:hypothetical protein
MLGPICVTHGPINVTLEPINVTLGPINVTLEPIYVMLGLDPSISSSTHDRKTGRRQPIRAESDPRVEPEDDGRARMTVERG